MDKATGLLLLIRASGLLAELHESGVVDELKDDIAALNAKFTSVIAPKPDGTPWTTEDIRDRSARINAKLDAIEAERRASGPDGHP
jgi:hypothetical protein